MRVCHLTSVHPATDVRIFEKEARSLAKSGYQVFVVGRHPADETRAGIEILAVQPPKSRLLRMFFFTWAVLLRGLSTKSTIFHIHDPELMPAGVLLRLIGKKVICDIHEYLPEDVLHKKDYIPKFFRRAISLGMRVTQKVCTRFYNAIVTVTPAIADRFPPHKTFLVQNYPILADSLRNLPERSISDQPTILFTGGIARIRSSVEMVEAMTHLHDLNARLLIAGPTHSPELLPDIEASAGRAATKFLGQVSRDEINQLLISSTIGLLLVHANNAYKEFSSNKLYEYMLAGMPLVVADIPAWRWTADELGYAVLVDPMNPVDIARGIRELLENPEDALRRGRIGREAALARFNWDNEAKSLEAAYNYVLGK